MIRVVAHHWSPICRLLPSSSPSGGVRVAGVMGHLLSALFDRHNTSYEVRGHAGNLGVPLANGSWTGMSGAIHRQEADLMLGPPLMSWTRFQIMDFSSALMFDETAILSAKSSSTSSSATTPLTFGQCFSTIVWLFSLATLVILFALLVATDRLHGTKSLSNCFLFFFERLLSKSSQWPPVFAQRRTSGALLMAFVFFVTQCLTSMIGVNLIVIKDSNLIQTLRQLSQIDSCLPVSFVGTIGGHRFLMAVTANDSDPVERAIGRRMVQMPEREFVSSETVSALSQRRLAFISSEIRLRMLAMNVCTTHPSPPSLHISEERVHWTPRALGLSRHTVDRRLRARINADISRLHSANLFDLWVRRALNSAHNTCLDSREVDASHEISLKTLSLLLWAQMALQALAIHVFVVEKLFTKNFFFKFNKTREH